MPIFYSRSAALLALLTPLVALPSRHGSTAVFYLFVLLAVVAMIHHRLRPFDVPAPQGLVPMAVALVAPLISVLITSWAIGEFSGSEFEKNLRFALGVPILWLLAHVPLPRLRRIQWGLAGAALTGSAMLIAMLGLAHLDRGAAVEFGAGYNAVTLANLTLMFGLMTVVTLPWSCTRWPRVEAAAKIAIAFLSAWAALLSGTRSSWLIIPVFLVVLLLTTKRLSMARRCACMLAALAALALAAFLLKDLNPRVAQILPEIRQFLEDGPKDTSIGIRLQLWEASLLMFRDHPWLGIGAVNFREALHELMLQGVVTPVVAEGFGEPHNDFMAALAGYGVLGLTAALALFFLPAALFALRLKHAPAMTGVAGRLGLLLCLGFATFALTEMMFRNMRTVPVYTTLLLVFHALARDRGDQSSACSST